MNNRLLMATFQYEDDLLAATAEVRRQGLKIVDAYTPYAVHGLDRAMGLKPSRLTWVCFSCGLFGALFAFWFEHWSAAVGWPLDVGGKPWNAIPSDTPIAFEMMVLFAGFGSVFALLGVCRLFPGKKAVIPSTKVTDDQFVLMLDEAGSDFDLPSVHRLLKQFHVVDVAEHLTIDTDNSGEK